MSVQQPAAQPSVDVTAISIAAGFSVIAVLCGLAVVACCNSSSPLSARTSTASPRTTFRQSRKGESRMRWLTRSEAARLLWTCWRYREVQAWNTGTRKGKQVATKKRPLRHLARFILLGLYTGTRAGAIASAAFQRGEGRSYVDLDEGVYYCLAQGRRATNKRQPPVKLPSHVLARLRVWSQIPRKDGTLPEYVVEWNGRPVASVKTAFATAVRLAGLEEDASPHVLRHTAATWLMQQGVNLWEAAGYLGMTPEMLQKVYGHHHPDFQNEAASAFKNRRRKPQSLVKPLAKPKSADAGA